VNRDFPSRGVKAIATATAALGGVAARRGAAGMWYILPIVEHQRQDVGPGMSSTTSTNASAARSAPRAAAATKPPLNERQREAVHAPVGPLLVLAGAGTGKTRVVIARMAHLVRGGTRPGRILAVTFTNKAAREMLARAGSLLGGNTAEKPEISTIHSLCVRVLRRHAATMGYPERFAIIDRGEQETAARRALKELKIAEARLQPADLLDRIGRWKSAGIRPDAAVDSGMGDDDTWSLAAAGYRRYQQALKTAGAVDFDDLLLVVDELFTKHEAVRREEAGRFDHILVDEYQDTSGIQERIVTSLARDHRSLCVVGDDDQSIYAWRGAQISHILEFARRWPGARVVRLEENYRSTPEIIRAANQLISCNPHRHGKTLVATAPSGVPPTVVQAQDEIDESVRVVGEVESRLRDREIVPSEAAILVRTGDQTRVFEQELRRRGIPSELVGSRSFFDRREVKDVMAFLRVMIDPDDDMALSRIANVPPRGLSAQTIVAARAAAAVANHSLWRELVAARAAGRLTPAAAQGVAALEAVVALRQTRPTAEGGAAELLRTLMETVRYRGHLDKDCDDQAEADERWGSVEELAAALAVYERTHRGQDLPRLVRGFLDELVLEVTEAERFRDDKPRGKVLRLMTLHAAKGLEFDAVWMVGMEEGLLPHHRSLADAPQAIDEERRLCYVGVTRAKKRLTLSLCLTRMKWGKCRPSRPSRFLYELTGQADKFVAEPPRQPPGPPQGGRRGGKKRPR
jgi:DNA helicase-2/ATP-dependent DNA helicase PcrA